MEPYISDSAPASGGRSGSGAEALCGFGEGEAVDGTGDECV